VSLKKAYIHLADLDVNRPYSSNNIWSLSPHCNRFHIWPRQWLAVRYSSMFETTRGRIYYEENFLECLYIYREHS